MQFDQVTIAILLRAEEKGDCGIEILLIIFCFVSRCVIPDRIVKRVKGGIAVLAETAHSTTASHRLNLLRSTGCSDAKNRRHIRPSYVLYYW